jgi:hypothetical protein
MPKYPKHPKRPRDPNQLGKMIVDLAAGAATEEKADESGKVVPPAP